MKLQRSPLQHLSDQVAVLARRQEGTILLGELSSAGFATVGEADLRTVLDGQSARCPTERSALIEWLAHRASADEMAAMALLVVLRPELETISLRLAGGAFTGNAEADALAAGWEVVAHGDGVTGHARIEAIWTRARRTAGLRRWRTLEMVELTSDVDVPAPESDPLERWPGLLAAAVAAGVLTARQVVIVAQSRMEGRSITEVARTLGRPCGAVYKERERAERALRTFALSYEERWAEC